MENQERRVAHERFAPSPSKFMKHVLNIPPSRFHASSWNALPSLGVIWAEFCAEHGFLPSSAARCSIFFFDEYLNELKNFLVAPTEAHASIVLGLVAASVLLLIFVYTLAVAAVTDLALGHHRQWGLFSIHIGHQEGRLYAATLRFFLLMIIFIAAAYLIILGIKTARLGYIVQYAVEAGLLMVLANDSAAPGLSSACGRDGRNARRHPTQVLEAF